MTSITDGALTLLFETVTLTDYVVEAPKNTQSQPKEAPKNVHQKIAKTIMLFPDDFEITEHREIYTFYKNILKAIQLPEASAERMNESAFSEKLMAPGTFVICWGTNFGSDENKYQIIDTKSGGKFMYTDAVNHVSVDKNMKTNLWQKLKPLYNV